MKCAFLDKECDDECAAFTPDEEVRESEYVWDTCLNEYIQKWTQLRQGDFCMRLGNLIEKGKAIAKGGKVL